jgi:hypothetical protein
MRLYHSIPVNTLLVQEFVDAMHAKRSITITSTAALSTSTMRANRVSARSLVSAGGNGAGDLDFGEKSDRHFRSVASHCYIS